MVILSKVFKAVARFEKAFVGIAMLMCTSIILLSVVGRRMGNAPQWAEEAVRYLMIWITFVGSGICFRRSSHYGIDVIKRIRNVYFQKFVAIFVIVANAVFAFMLAFYGTKYALFTFNSNQLTAALAWPIWILYVTVPIGGCLIILHLIEVFLCEILNKCEIQE